MDIEARQALWGVLKDFKSSGRTVLLCTHYMDEAEVLGDRIAIMADGHIVCSGTATFLKKLYSNYWLFLSLN